MNTVSDAIRYVGVNDHQVDLFEGQYVVPNGMSYNSYVILDEKIAVMDTVDIHFTHEWLDNLTAAFGGRTPGLSGHPAHGAGSFRQYRQFLKNLAQYHHCRHGKSVCDDGKFLR